MKRLALLAKPQQTTDTYPEGHWRNPCHLLDDNGRAFCRADVTGRRVHERTDCYCAGHTLCAWCEALDATNGGREA